MPALQTVLFDLDGTLIDSIQLIIDSYHHTLEVHGIPARTDKEWLDGIGTPLRVQFAEWAHDEERMEAMIDTYREYNIFHHDSRVRVYPGVVDMVQAVRAAGCRTGLVTSKNRVGAFRGLRVAGLEEAMDVVIGADDVVQSEAAPGAGGPGGRPPRRRPRHDGVRRRQRPRHAFGPECWGPHRRGALGPVRPFRPGAGRSGLLARAPARACNSLDCLSLPEYIAPLPRCAALATRAALLIFPPGSP